MTFFSGTDTNTLREEGRDRNHFVSLIVNNEGTYTAAITVKVTSTKRIEENITYKTFNDEEVTINRPIVETDEYIEYYNLSITKEGTDCSFKELDERISEIQKRKKESNHPNSFNSPIITNPIIKTPTLFNEGYMESEPPRIIHSNHVINIKEKDIQHIVTQLITGSIIIRDTSKLDIDKWVNTMPNIFGDRFGRDEGGFKDFEYWADNYCEFLLREKVPCDLGADDESDYLSSLASTVYNALDKLPKNRYIEKIKELITQWMI